MVWSDQWRCFLSSMEIQLTNSLKKILMNKFGKVNSILSENRKFKHKSKIFAVLEILN